MRARALLILALLPLAASAQLGKFFGPGELSKYHAALDGMSGCQSCHGQGSPHEKCQKCHVEIKERIENGKGYHAKRSDYKCGQCHTEHKGRENDLVGLTKMRLNHEDTGWPLTGAHQKVPCLNCHTQKRVDPTTGKETAYPTYLKAVPECAACHKDPHEGKLGTACRGCHDTAAWKAPKPVTTAPSPVPSPAYSPSPSPVSAKPR